MNNQISFLKIGDVEIIIGNGMHQFPYHTHNSFMFGAILDGSASFIIDNQQSNLYKGDSYIVPSNKGISIAPISNFSYLTACLKKGLIVSKLKKHHISDYFYKQNADELFELVKKISSKEFGEFEFIDNLIEVYQLIEIDDRTESISKYINDAKRYLEDNVESRFNLGELANEIYVSKYYLIKLFKKELGITPKQYHQQCKMRFIKDNIYLFTQVQMANELGFTTQSHMGNIFKKYMGITLKTYADSIIEEQ